MEAKNIYILYIHIVQLSKCLRVRFETKQLFSGPPIKLDTIVRSTPSPLNVYICQCHEHAILHFGVLFYVFMRYIYSYFSIHWITE